jgi:hypothetical protein
MTSSPPPAAIDVAFTFLAQDEKLALDLALLLRTSVSTFVYSEHQKDLAGKDGVAQFTDIYQNRAKFVVVLYREGYGETKWTRIEQTAVTSRALEMGWNSILLISLDGTVPTWLPLARLFYGIEKFGPKGAADAILGRFHELGQEGRPESLTEFAARLSRTIESKEEAELWERSTAGVKAAEEEVAALRQGLITQIGSINEAAPKVTLSVIEPPYGVVGVRAGRRRVTFNWESAYSNTIQHSYLFVRESQYDPGSGQFETARELRCRLKGPQPRVWVADEEPNLPLTTPQLIQWHIRRLLSEPDDPGWLLAVIHRD